MKSAYKQKFHLAILSKDCTSLVCWRFEHDVSSSIRQKSKLIKIEIFSVGTIEYQKHRDFRHAVMVLSGEPFHREKNVSWASAGANLMKCLYPNTIYPHLILC